MSDAKKGTPRPDISKKIKEYYSKNLSSRCKSIIDTRTGILYNKVIDLRTELNLTEYMYKHLLTKGILVWNKK